MAMSEFEYRERERVLREYRNSIDALAKKASAEVETKYANMYGQNWRTTLTTENASVIEESVRMEKIQAQARIEEVMFGLKNTQYSPSMTLKK
jgi:hypothetical protein